MRFGSASASSTARTSSTGSWRPSSCSPRTRLGTSRHDASSPSSATDDRRYVNERPEPAPSPTDRPSRPDPATVRQRSWAEVRWRQFRGAPRPVVRAVAASLSVAIVLALLYLAYDVALSRGAQLPGGDLRTLAVAVYVVLVLVIGSVVTWVVVPQPTGAGTVARRNRWSAALGFFAAVPIAYLVLVVAVQVLKPLLT